MESTKVSYVVRRVLTREGIIVSGMRWTSTALSALRDRLGGGAQVVVRLDPTYPTHAFVLDDERRRWVQGRLVAEAGSALDPQGSGEECAPSSDHAGRDAVAGVRAASADAVPPTMDGKPSPNSHGSRSSPSGMHLRARPASAEPAGTGRS